MIKLERCRQHNRSNSPAEFETVSEHVNAADAIRECWDYQTTLRASGDEFRLTQDGVELIILSETEVAPVA
jgi:hypothetical protein